MGRNEDIKISSYGAAEIEGGWEGEKWVQTSSWCSSVPTRPPESTPGSYSPTSRAATAAQNVNDQVPDQYENL